MPPLTMHEEGFTKGNPVPPTALVQVPLKPLLRLLGKAVSRAPDQVSRVGGCPHMCPWVAPNAHSFGRQLWGLPSCVEYLSPQRILFP